MIILFDFIAQALLIPFLLAFLFITGWSVYFIDTLIRPLLSFGRKAFQILFQCMRHLYHIMVTLFYSWWTVMILTACVPLALSLIPRFKSAPMWAMMILSIPLYLMVIKAFITLFEFSQYPLTRIPMKSFGSHPMEIFGVVYLLGFSFYAQTPLGTERLTLASLGLMIGMAFIMAGIYHVHQGSFLQHPSKLKMKSMYAIDATGPSNRSSLMAWVIDQMDPSKNSYLTTSLPARLGVCALLILNVSLWATGLNTYESSWIQVDHVNAIDSLSLTFLFCFLSIYSISRQSFSCPFLHVHWSFVFCSCFGHDHPFIFFGLDFYKYLFH